MTRCDILFETAQFNVSEVKEHFINPCCFGEDLAEWLRRQLTANGITAGPAYQEDLGMGVVRSAGRARLLSGNDELSERARGPQE
jgi:hypothetical protein